MQRPADAIFKAYDIRGIVGQTLTAEVAYQIGQAFARLARAAGEQAVWLGYDGRLSSPALAEALASGLLDSGLDVICLGCVTTPMLYFATHQGSGIASVGDSQTIAGSRSGLMVTGSHNPPEYNGFKLVLQQETLSSAAIQGLKQAIYTLPDASTAQRGQRHLFSIAAAYQQAIVDDIHLARPLKVVMDAGNGIAGAYAPALFEALGCEVIPLYCEVDGHFPHHHPDPVEAHNLQALIATVQTHQAELGIAFDGDGDRLGVVTRDGQIIRSDRQLMLFIPEVLRQHPGSPVVFDVKSSRHLAPFIRQHGGIPVMWKTGHSLMKAKLKETAAPLGGELSGHLFFNDRNAGQPRWFGFDDGLYSAARLLEVVSRQPDASAVLAALPDSLNTPELQIAVADGQAHALIADLQTHAQFAGAEEILMIDGLRVGFADGFGLVRASNTTPVLTLRFEADTPAALARIQAEFAQQLLARAPGLKLPF